MNPRYSGPAVLPPAPEVRKRIEAHLDSLPAWSAEPRTHEGAAEDAAPSPKVRRSP